MGDKTDIDTTAMSSNVMLVKVPKYVSKLWERVGPGGSVGKLRVSSKLKKRDFTFILKQELLKQSSEGELKLPSEYKLHSQGAGNRVAEAFSETASQDQDGSGNGSSSTNQTGKLALEGQIAERVECRPVGGDSYMKMKRLQIKNALQPTRTTQPIDKTITFKPRTNKNVNEVIIKPKSAEGKKARLDKDKVLDMLFKAFEKHQYYSFKDLVQITQQPSPYLKEILKEIGKYNTKAPHKFMWELKPEYRHYQEDQPS
ncbi:putative general transcription factor IIF subunit 2 isoform X1 [Apostichopus japonicus]|uniref:General transcription factor IIF subunit 2 n=1 Tax=Stichopus japonicus TaxID=307972 RepID=A0A2G8JY11_STIJA|nr:putative general transcription factor IIF subunit 2 isoform X1 [Apostichopus japonicus]